jgi:hypothetical protein
MKSQDIFLLLKLVSLEKQEKNYLAGITRAWPSDWQDWENEIYALERDGLREDASFEGADYAGGSIISRYTARALEDATGISKSQVNLSLKRCQDVGLLRHDRKTGLPRVNAKALTEFIVFGLKYVFPARPAEIVRGVATAFAAPVLEQKLMSAGELIPVWPDARGNTKGQSIEPLFKSVPIAVRKDPELYALLALVDAIRIGQPREVNLAIGLLKQHMEVRE